MRSNEKQTKSKLLIYENSRSDFWGLNYLRPRSAAELTGLDAWRPDASSPVTKIARYIKKQRNK